MLGGRSDLRTAGELARLASEGLTNTQIAAALTVSVRTVETHLARA